MKLKQRIKQVMTGPNGQEYALWVVAVAIILGCVMVVLLSRGC